MIVVSVDLWPHGHLEHRRPVGTIDIVRVNDGPPALYEAALRDPDGTVVTVVDVAHDRDDGWLELVRRVCDALDDDLAQPPDGT